MTKRSTDNAFSWRTTPSITSADLQRQETAKARSTKTVEKRRASTDPALLKRNKHSAPPFGGAYSKAKPYGRMGEGV